MIIFQSSLSDDKSALVCRTLLSILADLNSAVVWMVSIIPLISNTPTIFSKTLRTVPRAPTTGITVTFLRFFCFFFVIEQGLSTSLSFRFLEFLFTGSLE